MSQIPGNSPIFNSITCIYIYLGTYHACGHAINGAITIDSCPDNCAVFLQEVDKRKYYHCRWQENEDGYPVCGIYREKLGF